MPQTSIETLWDDTPRPDWAGTGTITWECVEANTSYRDSREKAARDQLRWAGVFGPKPAGPGPCGHLPEGLHVPRPTRITATVVPVSTAGHPMLDVVGRQLTGTGLPRGHVLAASLGGLDVAENMVPQAAVMNTNQESFLKSPPSAMKWRELEQYAAFCALAVPGGSRRSRTCPNSRPCSTPKTRVILTQWTSVSGLPASGVRHRRHRLWLPRRRHRRARTRRPPAHGERRGRLAEGRDAGRGRIRVCLNADLST
jgi:hypothetical protein